MWPFVCKLSVCDFIWCSEWSLVYDMFDSVQRYYRPLEYERVYLPLHKVVDPTLSYPRRRHVDKTRAVKGVTCANCFGLSVTM